MEELYKSSTLPHDPDRVYLDDECQEMVTGYFYDIG